MIFVFSVQITGETKLILDFLNSDNLLISRHTWCCEDGLNVWRISIEKSKSFANLELYPENNNELAISLYFSDVISRKDISSISDESCACREVKKPANKVKCVAWDLDNTIWNGIIGDDGIEGITINQEAVDVVKKLDQRGILNTICSKNDEGLALAGLERFGVRDYFVYPKINWNKKSDNLIETSKELNINIDTFAFIDDSAFERNEVSNSLSEVRVYADTDIKELLSKREFDVPVTADSIKRRSFYLTEEKRRKGFKENLQSSSDGYKAFILSCELCAEVHDCIESEDIKRCHELIMRTNQLNASANRISYDDFCSLVSNPRKKVLTIKCHDKYGDYGTVGCLIMEEDAQCVVCTDFVMSCRIAKKKVESAVIMRIMNRFERPLSIVYHPTQRNYVLLDEFLTIGGKYEEEKGLVSFKKAQLKDFDWVKVEIR